MKRKSGLKQFIRFTGNRIVIKALLDAHPYEEVAYDIYPLANPYPQAGSGMVGELPEPVSETVFPEKSKESFQNRSYPALRIA